MPRKNKRHDDSEEEEEEQQVELTKRQKNQEHKRLEREHGQEKSKAMRKKSQTRGAAFDEDGFGGRPVTPPGEGMMASKQSDDEDEEDKAEEEEEEHFEKPVPKRAQQKGGKKGRKGDDDESGDDEDRPKQAKKQKAKKDSWEDFDDDETKEPVEEEEEEWVKKKRQAKKQKAKKDSWEDFDDVDEVKEPEEEEEKKPAKKQQPKKQPMKKKDSWEALDDDDEETKEPEEEEKKPAKKQQPRKQQMKKKDSWEALDDDDEETKEPEEEEKKPVKKQQPRKQQMKKDSWEALDDDDEETKEPNEEEEEEQKPAKKQQPKKQPAKKAQKAAQPKKFDAWGALDDEEVKEEEGDGFDKPDDFEEAFRAQRAPSKKQARKQKQAKADDWYKPQPHAEEEKPAEAPKGQKAPKKGRKNREDPEDVYITADADMKQAPEEAKDEAEAPSKPQQQQKKGKKGKKNRENPDDFYITADADMKQAPEGAEKEQPAAPAKQQPKGKKGRKNRENPDDVYITADADMKQEEAAEEEEKPQPQQQQQQKKGKKGKKNRENPDDFYITADADMKQEAQPEQAAEPAPEQEEKKGAPQQQQGKKGAKKPTSAIRQAMQELVQKQKEEEERLARLEEQRLRKAQALAAKREEEERQREAERKKKSEEDRQRNKELEAAAKARAEDEARRNALRRLGLSDEEIEKRLNRPQDQNKSAPNKKGPRGAQGKGGKQAPKQQQQQQQQQQPKKQEQPKAAEKKEEPPKKKEEPPKKKEEPAKKKEEEEDSWESLLEEEEGDAKEEKAAASKEEPNEEKKEEPKEQQQQPAAAAATTAAEAAKAEAAPAAAAASEGEKSGMVLRSPICSVLGHVDVGKTQLLDKIRRTDVGGSEAGHITQQIGASFFPIDAIQDLCSKFGDSVRKLQYRVPGLLVIDTPGHESFSNLRSRGSSLCDLAILVVDIMHGIEPQTIESINMLRERRTPFVVALNKVDRLFMWKPTAGAPFRASLAKQSASVRAEFEARVNGVIADFAVQNLNAMLYYKTQSMKEMRSYVQLVPTSAVTGEGIPDLLMLVIQLTQKLMENQLFFRPDDLRASVLEVKTEVGLGPCIDVILVNGTLRDSDRIVVCGMNGPIVTDIRALLTPEPLKEIRVKSPYVHHKVIQAAQGVRICANGLEDAVAGSQLLVVRRDDDLEALKEEVQKDLKNMQAKVDRSGVGVSVQASTLGALEALLRFLNESKVPVSAIRVGPVVKKDVTRCSVMLDKDETKRYAVMLCFDVRVERDAAEMAERLGIKIFTANIIYHLFDQFSAYMKKLEDDERERASRAGQMVWPVVLEILPEHIINKHNPIILGCRVKQGSLRIGTPISVVVPNKENPKRRDTLYLGRVVSIEKDHRSLEGAAKDQEVAVKIEPDPGCQAYFYERHFDYTCDLVSRITRESLDVLKEHHRDVFEKDREMLLLLFQLRTLFGIEGTKVVRRAPVEGEGDDDDDDDGSDEQEEDEGGDDDEEEAAESQ